MPEGLDIVGDPLRETAEGSVDVIFAD